MRVTETGCGLHKSGDKILAGGGGRHAFSMAQVAARLTGRMRTGGGANTCRGSGLIFHRPVKFRG